MKQQVTPSFEPHVGEIWEFILSDEHVQRYLVEEIYEHSLRYKLKLVYSSSKYDNGFLNNVFDYSISSLKAIAHKYHIDIYDALEQILK